MAKKTKDESVITFAEEAKRIEKKYKDKITDPISKQAYILEMQKLKAKNDMARAMYENTEKMKRTVQEANSKTLNKGVMSKGGMLPKYYLGNLLGIEDPNLLKGIDLSTYDNLGKDLTSNQNPPINVGMDWSSMPSVDESITYPGAKKFLTPRKDPNPFQMSMEKIPSLEKTNKPKDTNLNPIAAGLKSMQLLNSLKNAITPALNETPILPDYSRSDEAFGKMSTDNTEAINQITRSSNTQRGQINENTMSDAVRQARLAGSNINLMNAISGNMLSSQQIKNALLGQKGSYEMSKAGANAQSLYQNRIDNLQNQAAKKLAGEQFIQNLSQVGSEVNKYQMFKDMMKNQKDLAILKTSEGMNFINSLSDTFGIDLNALSEYKNYTNDPSETNRDKLMKAIQLKIKG